MFNIVVYFFIIKKQNLIIDKLVCV